MEKFHFKTVSLLEGLPSDVFQLLKENMQRLEVKKNKVIYSEGVFSKGIYILRKGKVKISQMSAEGKEQIVYIYKKGEIMGYRPLISGGRHPVTASALEPTILSFIPGKVFLKALDLSPLLSKRLLVNLAHEFSVWVNMMSILGQQPARERVAFVLLILREKYKSDEKDNASVSFRLTRENIANYARTTVETLVRMLRFFKDENIIKTEGRKIIILKPKELEKIASFIN